MHKKGILETVKNLINLKEKQKLYKDNLNFCIRDKKNHKQILNLKKIVIGK